MTPGARNRREEIFFCVIMYFFQPIDHQKYAFEALIQGTWAVPAHLVSDRGESLARATICLTCLTPCFCLSKCTPTLIINFLTRINIGYFRDLLKSSNDKNTGNSPLSQSNRPSNTVSSPSRPDFQSASTPRKECPPSCISLRSYTYRSSKTSNHSPKPCSLDSRTDTFITS